jgi:hypothetical protein
VCKHPITLRDPNQNNTRVVYSPVAFGPSIAEQVGVMMLMLMMMLLLLLLLMMMMPASSTRPWPSDPPSPSRSGS